MGENLYEVDHFYTGDFAQFLTGGYNCSEGNAPIFFVLLLNSRLSLSSTFVVLSLFWHDSQVDLSIPGIPCYKDKGYAGAYCKDTNATMDKASREHPLTIEKIRRNLRITRKRSPGERPYSVMKGIMHGAIPSHHGDEGTGSKQCFSALATIFLPLSH